MKNTESNIVEGNFFNTNVCITDEKRIRIFNEKGIEFDEYKPLCDRIAMYLIDEGFVTTKTPKVEIQIK